MILEFEDEKGLLDEQARGLMQLCADAAQRTEGVSCPLSVFISVVGDECDKNTRAVNGQKPIFMVLQGFGWAASARS